VKRYRSLGQGLVGDVDRAITLALSGAIAFDVIEYAITVWAYPGPISAPSFVRLFALSTTLSAILWLLLAAGLAVVLASVRLARAAIDRDLGRAPGWLDPQPLVAGIRPAVTRIWAAVATSLAIALPLQRFSVWAMDHYKEVELRAVMIAVAGVGAAGVAAVLYRVFAAATAVGARALAPTLRAANPLGRVRPAAVALAALVAGGMAASWLVLPQSRSAIPVRLIVSGIVVVFGMCFGGRFRWYRPMSKRRALAVGGGALVLFTGTLWQWGGEVETKSVAWTGSPAMEKLILVVRYANDVDGDGYGTLLGEPDCAPFDASINPGAIDIPDNGIDEDCSGSDYSLRDAIAGVPPGPNRIVPPKFQKTWNILFITIDTVRYDRTSFGGYRDGPKHRDTTPRLAELVNRSTTFTFTNAPSAGTMASIPAIITSKYFHSGIALDEHVPPGMPPKLKPENTLLMEIMKRKDYATGVIASHEYWNDWGMDQGVDDYDNSIGKTPDPFRVAADKVTDHALAWISRHQNTHWFLWAHYIDPHGRYVAHPDVVDWGDSEPDKYDAELRWTDQEVGRLFDRLIELPSRPNTIIIITSDHGDSMGEHEVPLGTHGTALWRELQHVPMIFYIPDNPPHEIHGAVSNLDIVPTIADLCGINVKDLSFEGKSLIGSIFYGDEDRERVVFAETNLPNDNRSRAAISERWKLIYYINSGLYALFDLKEDPWEHHNLAPSNPPELEKMKTRMKAWLERVTYARDPEFNQAITQVRDVLLTGPPTPAVATTGQTLDDGKLEILGIGPEDGKQLAAGAKVDVHVYFRVKEPTTEVYRFQLSVWPVDAAHFVPTDATPGQITRSSMHATANGFFSSDRWHAGEYIRERFTLQIPTDWKGDALVLGLAVTDRAGNKVKATGAAPANDPQTMVLGVLPFQGSSAPAQP
jgi:arylsulfatase A-like enzyme